MPMIKSKPLFSILFISDSDLFPGIFRTKDTATVKSLISLISQADLSQLTSLEEIVSKHAFVYAFLLCNGQLCFRSVS